MIEIPYDKDQMINNNYLLEYVSKLLPELIEIEKRICSLQEPNWSDDYNEIDKILWRIIVNRIYPMQWQVKEIRKAIEKYQAGAINEYDSEDDVLEIEDPEFFCCPYTE